MLHLGHKIKNICSNILKLRGMVEKSSVLPSFWCLIDVQTPTGSNVMASGNMCPVSDRELAYSEMNSDLCCT